MEAANEYILNVKQYCKYKAQLLFQKSICAYHSTLQMKKKKLNDINRQPNEKVKIIMCQ